jgi:hypothetical protein
MSLPLCAAVGMDRAEKLSSVAVYGSLLSNGSCIFVYLAAIAWKQVYIPQYVVCAVERRINSTKNIQIQSFQLNVLVDVSSLEMTVVMSGYNVILC